MAAIETFWPGLSAQPHETARAHMASRVPRAETGDSAAVVLDDLRGRRFDCAEAVFVTDRDGRLVGVVHMNDLLAARPDQAMAEIMEPEQYRRAAGPGPGGGRPGGAAAGAGGGAGGRRRGAPAGRRAAAGHGPHSAPRTRRGPAAPGRHRARRRHAGARRVGGAAGRPPAPPAALAAGRAARLLAGDPGGGALRAHAGRQRRRRLLRARAGLHRRRHRHPGGLRRGARPGRAGAWRSVRCCGASWPPAG